MVLPASEAGLSTYVDYAFQTVINNPMAFAGDNWGWLITVSLLLLRNRIKAFILSK